MLSRIPGTLQVERNDGTEVNERGRLSDQNGGLGSPRVMVVANRAKLVIAMPHPSMKLCAATALNSRFAGFQHFVRPQVMTCVLYAVLNSGTRRLLRA